MDLPPLRERADDIALLADFFIKKFAAAMNKPFTGLSPEALAALKSYSWPGNVRELANAMERAMVVGSPPLVRREDFPLPRLESNSEPAPDSLDDVERQHIARILDKTQGNVTQAAQLLQIDRATLYNKIKKYGLRK